MTRALARTTKSSGPGIRHRRRDDRAGQSTKRGEIAENEFRSADRSAHLRLRRTMRFAEKCSGGVQAEEGRIMEIGEYGGVADGDEQAQD